MALGSNPVSGMINDIVTFSHEECVNHELWKDGVNSTDIEVNGFGSSVTSWDNPTPVPNADVNLNKIKM